MALYNLLHKRPIITVPSTRSCICCPLVVQIGSDGHTKQEGKKETLSILQFSK